MGPWSAAARICRTPAYAFGLTEINTQADAIRLTHTYPWHVVRRLPAPYVDIAIAAALLIYAQIAVWAQPGVVPGPKAVAALGLTLVTAPLALRRRWPLAVAGVSMGALAVESLMARGAPEGAVVLLPVVVVLYTLGAYEPLDRALAGAAIALVAVVIQSVQDPKIVGTANVVLVDGFFFGIIGGAAWLVGRYVRSRRGIETTLHDRTASLERERAEQAAVLAAERSRIARELHDVVAHTVSVMGIQAAAAAEVLDRDPEQARAPLESIQQTARDAVDELKRLLAVLREEREAPDLAPQPDLSALDELVERSQASGVPVDLQIEGARRPLPPGIELTAYRVVQEALTNARKHAGPGEVRARIAYHPASLEIVVDDDGAAASPPNGHGHGIVGMRERILLYGGNLEAGPRSGGGFRVHALLPIDGVTR